MNNSQLRVWLVDDDASIRWVLERALKNAGMSPRLFEAAETALASPFDDPPGRTEGQQVVDEVTGREVYPVAGDQTPHLPGENRRAVVHQRLPEHRCGVYTHSQQSQRHGHRWRAAPGDQVSVERVQRVLGSPDGGIAQPVRKTQRRPQFARLARRRSASAVAAIKIRNSSVRASSAPFPV